MGGGAVLALAAFVVLMRCILAKEYVVRDGYCTDVEWDRYYNFQRWALDKDFFVGDTLVFKFSPVSSTVAEVTKAEFDGCTKALLPANRIRVYGQSPVTVNLSTAGPIYIANTIGSCERQRFVINVNVPMPSPPSGSSTSAAMTSSSTPQPPPPLSEHDLIVRAAIGSVLGFTMFMFKIVMLAYFSYLCVRA